MIHGLTDARLLAPPCSASALSLLTDSQVSAFRFDGAAVRAWRGRSRRRIVGAAQVIVVPQDHPDALTAASTASASLVSPTLRHHAESALNSPGSSGPTSFALSVLALSSASMMSSDRAGPASLGSGLGARRLRTLDAAPRVVVAWSRIRTIESCGRTTITTP